MSAGAGRDFWKMSGSGNDFIFFDARGRDGTDELETPSEIVALCAQHLGVGADGVVFVDLAPDVAFAIRYYNADGSRASLCGNASLCAAQSAVFLGLAQTDRRFDFISDAGRVSALVSLDGIASVRLAPVTGLEEIAREEPSAGEHQLGYAVVGVPHLVVLVGDVKKVDVPGRGASLRHSSYRAPAGANVNFVAPSGEAGCWAIRTYERGVEAETYACGTGAVATAACLARWGETAAGEEVALKTASGRELRVRLPVSPQESWSELSGEGRLVFSGVLRRYR